MDKVADFCRKAYAKRYDEQVKFLTDEAKKANAKKKLADSVLEGIEKAAQKEAIKVSFIESYKKFKNISASEIWSHISEGHMHRKSGVSDLLLISKIVSADQSWKKSSGHAFEEMIKSLASEALKNDDIEIVLQRDLSILIKAGEIANEPRDLSWLREQIKSSVFDLYALIKKDNKTFCYGCIQSKTSIRDRVTRDREPSLQAMASFFWSAVVVLDGEFMRMPKFTAMVNGGTTAYPENGWHGLYELSGREVQGRIYPLDLDFSIFRDHAILAAKQWLTQRQWFDHKWVAKSQGN